MVTGEDLKEDDEEENMELEENPVMLIRPAVEPVEVLAVLDERPGDVHRVCPAPGPGRGDWSVVIAKD